MEELKCPYCNETGFSELRLCGYSLSINKETGELIEGSYEDCYEFSYPMCSNCGKEFYVTKRKGKYILIEINVDERINKALDFLEMVLDNEINDEEKRKIKLILKKSLILNELKK